MSKRQMKRFNWPHKLSGYDFDGTIDDVIKRIREEEADLLEEHPDATDIRLDYSHYDEPYDGGCTTAFTFQYIRKETLEEMRERVAEEAAKKEQQLTWKRNQLEQLKKELGED